MSVSAKQAATRPSALEILDPAWKDLYRIGGWSALITAIFLPIQIAVFIIWPPPGFAPTLENTLSWINFFNANKLLGLLDLDLLIIVDMILGIPVMMALFAALRKVNQSIAALGLLLGMVGAVAYLAASPTLGMLALSDQYALAATEAQRAAILASGQVLLAINQGTAFHTYYILGSIAPILMCLVMLRSDLFPRSIAWIGIIANIVAFGLYVPVVGIYISIFSVFGLEAYNILVARRLLTA